MPPKCSPGRHSSFLSRSFTRLQFEAEFGRRFGRYRILAPEILKVLIGGQASDFGLVDVQFTAQMVGFMLEDAGRPAVQMFLMLVAVLILPTGGDVKPTLAYGLVTVEAQAAFVEAAGRVADRLITGVDDDVEREFGDFARIVLVVELFALLFVAFLLGPFGRWRRFARRWRRNHGFEFAGTLAGDNQV